MKYIYVFSILILLSTNIYSYDYKEMVGYYKLTNDTYAYQEWILLYKNQFFYKFNNRLYFTRYRGNYIIDKQSNIVLNLIDYFNKYNLKIKIMNSDTLLYDGTNYNPFAISNKIFIKEDCYKYIVTSSQVPLYKNTETNKKPIKYLKTNEIVYLIEQTTIHCGDYNDEYNYYYLVLTKDLELGYVNSFYLSEIGY